MLEKITKEHLKALESGILKVEHSLGDLEILQFTEGDNFYPVCRLCGRTNVEHNMPGYVQDNCPVEINKRELSKLRELLELLRGAKENV